jgi:uncharacterized membrane protein YecN with MAPEG domain
MEFPLQVVPLYAALLAVLFVALGVRTLLLRRRLGIGIGDGDDPAMLRAIRVHANFAEYVPMALLLLCLVELRGAGPLLLHALSLALLAGRLSHAFGVSRVDENYAYRVFGMAMTFTCLLACAGFLLWASRAAHDG